jgi:UDP-3-O-[3-hydroxymyristoyl] glucosamine N-acyltransferase
MPDPRFYETLPPVALGELAALVGGRLADEGRAGQAVAGVSVLARAGGGDITFCADRGHARELARSAAGACFVTGQLAPSAPTSCATVITPLPQAAYARAADRLCRPWTLTPGAPAVDPTAELEEDVSIAHGAIIGPRASIGRGCRIGPGAVVGPGVAIGRGGSIGPRVVIGFALIGDGVRIHAGAVIGEPGFGAAAGAAGVVDVPQLGRVILQDGVTIGANSCIDRGAFDDTVVGENTKIDNLVQIAHNVVIGRNCLLAAHTGISGSTIVGDGCIFGGRAGISDHIVIGPGARVAAAAGVMKDIPAGESWGGSPARPVVRWMRETAWLARLARRRAGSEERR